MGKKYKKFDCELCESKACTSYTRMGIYFYNLNDEIFEWLHDNEIEYEYIQRMTRQNVENPTIVFHYYTDLITFKIVFSEVVR